MQNIRGIVQELLFWDKFLLNWYIEKTYFKYEASNGLSSDKLIHNMDRKHPRLIERDPISNISTVFTNYFLAGK